jgi:hypothetical protein
MPIAVALDSGGCACGFLSPFAPFEFVIELVSFSTVVYFVLAGKKQRSRLLAVAASCVSEIAVLWRESILRVATAIRKQALTTFRVLGKVGRWLPILLIVLASLPPKVSALIDCASCGSPDPFQPIVFFAEVGMYGLAIWVFLNPKLPMTVGHSIYQALRFNVFHLSALPEGDLP